MDCINSPQCMIGTWAWGNGTNGSKIVFGKRYDEQQLLETFETAYQAGFTMWDTANSYGNGNSEKILGKCISKNKEVFISTKYLPTKSYKKGAMQNALKNSCERLGIKSPNIYWIHIPLNLEQNLKDAIELLKNNKIKSLGLSNVTLTQIKYAQYKLKSVGYSLAGIQNHYSLLNNNEEQKKIIKWCSENNATYFAYMVLEQGALSGHYDEHNSFPLISARGFSFSKRKFKRIASLLAYQKELAKKYRTDPSQIPILWAISKNTVPIIGLTNAKQSKCLSSISKIYLTDSESENLEQLANSSGVYVKRSWES